MSVRVSGQFVLAFQPWGAMMTRVLSIAAAAAAICLTALAPAAQASKPRVISAGTVCEAGKVDGEKIRPTCLLFMQAKGPSATARARVDNSGWFQTYTNYKLDGVPVYGLQAWKPRRIRGCLHITATIGKPPRQDKGKVRICADEFAIVKPGTVAIEQAPAYANYIPFK